MFTSSTVQSSTQQNQSSSIKHFALWAIHPSFSIFILKFDLNIYLKSGVIPFCSFLFTFFFFILMCQPLHFTYVCAPWIPDHTFEWARYQWVGQPAQRQQQQLSLILMQNTAGAHRHTHTHGCQMPICKYTPCIRMRWVPSIMETCIRLTGSLSPLSPLPCPCARSCESWCDERCYNRRGEAWVHNSHWINIKLLWNMNLFGLFVIRLDVSININMCIAISLHHGP